MYKSISDLQGWGFAILLLVVFSVLITSRLPLVDRVFPFKKNRELAAWLINDALIVFIAVAFWQPSAKDDTMQALLKGMTVFGGIFVGWLRMRTRVRFFSAEPAQTGEQMSTRSTVKLVGDNTIGPFAHLYREVFDEDSKYVYLEVQGVPFEASSSIDLSGEGRTRIALRLPNAMACKLGLLEGPTAGAK